MEPEGSLPCSQDPATGSYPEPYASSSHPPTLIPKIHSNVILPLTPKSSEWSLPFRISDQNIVHISHLSSACYMPRPSNPPLFDLTNNIWWSVKLWSFSE